MAHKVTTDVQTQGTTCETECAGVTVDSLVPHAAGSAGMGSRHSGARAELSEHIRLRANEFRMKSSTAAELSRNETELRVKMYFHISNPLNRWKKFRQGTSKFILQLTKTFCIVAQIVLFANSLAGQQSLLTSKVHTVLSKILIQDANPSTKLGTISPSVTYKTYSATRAMDKLEFAARNYYTRPFPAIGYDLPLSSNGSLIPIQVNAALFAVADLNASDNFFAVNLNIVKKTFYLLPPAGNSTISQQFLSMCGDKCFDRLKTMELIFSVNVINIISPNLGLVFCNTAQFKLFITALDSGMWTFVSTTIMNCVPCNNATVLNAAVQDNFKIVVGFSVLLDVILILVASSSFFLTLQALQTAYILVKAMKMFYQNRLNITLKKRDCRTLYPYWHLFTIISDLCTCIATIVKIVLDLNFNCQDSYRIDDDIIRILLSIGIVLHATVILRYVSYFRKFNILSRALDTAALQLFKYILFVAILFIGFMLCGWVVMSPYHLKFKNIILTFSTLFTVLNGDDLYNTFTGFDIYDNIVVFLFSQAFLVIFMTLFIYIVLNLFISLIVKAREESQVTNEKTKNEVMKFVYSKRLTEGAMSLNDLGLSKTCIDPDEITGQVKMPEKSVN